MGPISSSGSNVSDLEGTYSSSSELSESAQRIVDILDFYTVSQILWLVYPLFLLLQ